jgi:hypothetical protein
VALAEGGEKAAIRAFEHLLDPGVAAGRERRRQQAVAGCETVLHALAHRLELRRHQSTGLGRRESDRVLEVLLVQAEERAGSGRGGRASEHRTRVPAPGQHLRAMEREPDARTDLEAADRAEKQVGARGAGGDGQRGEHRRQHEACAMDGRDGVVVVELEALDVGAVQQRGGERGGGAAGSDERGRATAFKRGEGVGGCV